MEHVLESDTAADGHEAFVLQRRLHAYLTGAILRKHLGIAVEMDTGRPMQCLSILMSGIVYGLLLAALFLDLLVDLARQQVEVIGAGRR